MSQIAINLQVFWQSLVNFIAELGLEQKQQLLQVLEEEIARSEEDLLESDPTVQAEIQAAKNEYKAGYYLTLEEYMQKL